MQNAIKQLEGIVHQLVAAHRNNFLQHVADVTDQRLIVLDIPLLFEVHGEAQVASVRLILSSPVSPSAFVQECT